MRHAKITLHNYLLSISEREKYRSILRSLRDIYIHTYNERERERDGSSTIGHVSNLPFYNKKKRVSRARVFNGQKVVPESRPDVKTNVLFQVRSPGVRLGIAARVYMHFRVHTDCESPRERRQVVGRIFDRQTPWLTVF